MERGLLHPSLAGCLNNLPIRSPYLQMKLWMKEKQSFVRARALIKVSHILARFVDGGEPSLTPTQAKKLNALGLTFDDLFTLYLQSGTKEAFLAALKAKGIRGNLLGEKLVKALTRSR